MTVDADDVRAALADLVWWAKSEPQERAVLQDVFFPSGVPYGPEGFGTSETCPFFSMNHALGGETNDLASPTGFEPVSWP